jgi:hypothetical protein
MSIPNFVKIDKLLQKVQVEKHVKQIVIKVSQFREENESKISSSIAQQTPHFNYKCKPIAVFVQGANRGLF